MRAFSSGPFLLCDAMSDPRDVVGFLLGFFFFFFSVFFFFLVHLFFFFVFFFSLRCVLCGKTTRRIPETGTRRPSALSPLDRLQRDLVLVRALSTRQILYGRSTSFGGRGTLVRSSLLIVNSNGFKR